MEIKMVCSDLDGTLLPYGRDKLGDEVFEVIQELAAKGILFCPASGRQYKTMRKMFDSVAEHCTFLCQNGASLYHHEKLLGTVSMPHALVKEITEDFWNNSDGKGEVMLSTPGVSYIMERSLGLVDRLKVLGNEYITMQSPEELPENADIVKVSLYIGEGVEKYVSHFVPKWKTANAAVAGPLWIDTNCTDKGRGVAMLCEHLGIAPQQVMAFGDNYNDTAMLDFVGHPYLMESAAEELLDRYPTHTKSPVETLRQYLTLIS